MGRKAKLYTVAAVMGLTGKSESTVRRALKGVEPAGSVDGYNGRIDTAYSREQVAKAFPRKRGRPAKAGA